MAAALAGLISGCGADDDDDAVGAKQPIPMDQVPPAVLKAAREAAPDVVSFHAAYKDKFQGRESIELKGKTKTGKIKEIEVSPEGKYLGAE